MTRAEPCPYTVGRRVCVAGDRGHAGRHDWPPVCTSRKRGRLCDRPADHGGLHYASDATRGRYYWPRRIAGTRNTRRITA